MAYDHAPKIMLSGGGTGGHITPLLAVAHELKNLRPDCRVIYVGENNGKFAHITEGNSDIDESYTIAAGKFRRYHGESWFQRLIDVKTNLLNLRDTLRVIIGMFQSRHLLKKVKPDAILLKGGFVGVPIGLAAKKKIPFITHDSDALPGLANRLVSRWARIHAVALPVDAYKYPPEQTVQVGVLVGPAYKPVDKALQKSYRLELELPIDAQVLVITGGSHGARLINQVVVSLVPELLNNHPELVIIHQVGKGNSYTYDSFSHDRLKVIEFLDGMYRYTGSADIVITRAGANTLAELGVQGKACIVIPNPNLTAGHQLKNADLLVQKDAVVVVQEDALTKDKNELKRAIDGLLANEARRQELAKNFRDITITDAASKLAELLLKTAEN